MNRRKVKLSAAAGHTLLELVIVIVLIAILAGISFFGLFRSIELYTTTTRDHIDVIGEAKIALEKISREIREAPPGNITLGSESITLVKRTGHATDLDPGLEVSFTKDGTVVRRISAAGTFDLVGNVLTFAPSWNESTEVVTIDLTLARGGNIINLRTATAPRQKAQPTPED